MALISTTDTNNVWGKKCLQDWIEGWDEAQHGIPHSYEGWGHLHLVHIDQHKETLKDSDSLARNVGTHEESECKAGGVTRGEVNKKVPCLRTEEAMEIVDELLAKAKNVDELTNKGSVSLEGNVDAFDKDMIGEVNTHKETI
ncbi:hypothetical protein Droror1_Dr00018584 [Drosera rotundifolia]